jgi:zinc transporter, ZIP family
MRVAGQLAWRCWRGVTLDGVPENLAMGVALLEGSAGAVLASLADTLMPEAFSEGGPPVAYATALGLLLSFMISAA